MALGAVALFTYAQQEEIPLRVHHGGLVHLLPWFTAAGAALIALSTLAFVAIGVLSHATIRNSSETLALHLEQTRWRHASSSFAASGITIAAAFGLPTLFALASYAIYSRGTFGGSSFWIVGAFCVAVALPAVWLWRKAQVVPAWSWPVLYLLPVAICIAVSVLPIHWLLRGSASSIFLALTYAALVVLLSGLSAMGAHRAWKSGLARLIAFVFVAFAGLFLATPAGPRGAQHALALLGLGGGLSFDYYLNDKKSSEDFHAREPSVLHAALIIDTGDQLYLRTCAAHGGITVLPWSRVLGFSRRVHPFRREVCDTAISIFKDSMESR